MAYQRNLSHIKTLTELQSEIRNVKASIAMHETNLKGRIKQMPGEARKYAVIKTVPAALMRIIPFILTKGAVGNSFGFLKHAAGLFSVFKKQKGNTMKDRIMNTVKKAGAAAAIKSVFNIIQTRKQNTENKKIQTL